MQAVTTIGLDIAKSVFQVHGVDAAGPVLIRRQLKRVFRSCPNSRHRPAVPALRLHLPAMSYSHFDPTRTSVDHLTDRLPEATLYPSRVL
jgi:hypothetical protein